MTIAEALTVLAEPEYEPFRQVAWKPADYVAWQTQHDRRLEALKVAGREK